MTHTQTDTTSHLYVCVCRARVKHTRHTFIVITVSVASGYSGCLPTSTIFVVRGPTLIKAQPERMKALVLGLLCLFAPSVLGDLTFQVMPKAQECLFQVNISIHAHTRTRIHSHVHTHANTRTRTHANAKNARMKQRKLVQRTISFACA